MRRSTKALILCICVIGIIAGVVIHARFNEPRYEGRSLRYWLEMVSDRKSESEKSKTIKAVKAIGTNGVPFLLELMTYQPPEWKRSFFKVYNRTIGRTGRARMLSLDDKRITATTGFEILGAEAAFAVPELTSMMNQGNGPAARALSYLGPEGASAVIAALTNTNLSVRTAARLWGCRDLGSNAVPALPFLIQGLKSTNVVDRRESSWVLSVLVLEPDRVIPALQTSLDDPDRGVRFGAVNGITKFGTNSSLVVPALLLAMEKQDSFVSQVAKDALRKIAPDLITKPVP